MAQLEAQARREAQAQHMARREAQAEREARASYGGTDHLQQGLCCGFVFDDVDSCRDVPPESIQGDEISCIRDHLGHVTENFNF
jgi:hypothetical protein